MSTTATKRKPRAIKAEGFRPLPPVVINGVKTAFRGRPTLMSGTLLVAIRAICRVTCNPSYQFIAHTIGISELTFARWIKEYSGLREAIDAWRAEGIHRLRKKAYAIAKQGDGKMLRYILDRRDKDFMPREQVDHQDITPNFDRILARPDFL